MKKLISVLMLLVISFSLSACQSSKLDASVISTYLDDLKAGNFEKAKLQLETVPENFNYGDNEIMKNLFAKMNYEVKSTDIKGSEAKATVLISIPNTSLIYDGMMNGIGDDIQKLQAGGDAEKAKASDMMVTYLLKKINEEQVKRVENTIEMTLKIVDGKTVIVPNEDLSKALSGILVAK